MIGILPVSGFLAPCSSRWSCDDAFSSWCHLIMLQLSPISLQSFHYLRSSKTFATLVSLDPSHYFAQISVVFCFNCPVITVNMVTAELVDYSLSLAQFCVMFSGEESTHLLGKIFCKPTCLAHTPSLHLGPHPDS